MKILVKYVQIKECNISARIDTEHWKKAVIWVKSGSRYNTYLCFVKGGNNEETTKNVECIFRQVPERFKTFQIIRTKLKNTLFQQTVKEISLSHQMRLNGQSGNSNSVGPMHRWNQCRDVVLLKSYCRGIN